MNLLKVKNLVIRNIEALTSTIALAGLQAFILVASNNASSYATVLPPKNTTTGSVIKCEEIEEVSEEIIEPMAMTFNVDDMLATADENIAMLEEIHQQEYIDNLILSYETGYDIINDVEIDNETFELTFDNITYGHLPIESFELFVAEVACESNGNTHDALAVASSMLNRCDCEKWIRWLNNMGRDGYNPIDQITMPGQYNVYTNGSYRYYLNFNVTDDVLDACKVAWYLGIRNHNFCSFRSNSSVGYSDNQVVPGGNRFGGETIPIKPKILEMESSIETTS